MRLVELLEYEEFVIQCHDFPDADTLACGFALSCYLKSHNKNVRLVYSGKYFITKPNLLLMLKCLNIPVEYVSSINHPEVLILVDCCYGEGNVTKFDADHIFIIDHHLCDKKMEYPAEIRSNYGSCASVVAEMLKDADFDYNEKSEIATALYYGLYMDTNGLNEIRHPSDRDLRDFAKFDAGIIQHLKNSNLSLQEMKIAGDALKHYRYNEKYHFALVEAMSCDPNLLGFISDLLLQVDEVNTCVVFCHMKFGTKLSARSCINDIRANEMMEYIVQGHGSGGGHAQKAGGYIGECIAQDEVWNYIFNRLIQYHNSYEIINAWEYEIDLNGMKKYQKKEIQLGYVKLDQMFPVGTELCIRTLETDINICVDASKYLMVGIRGEVYPIESEKFERSYQVIDGEFTMKTDYVPNVIDKRNNTVMPVLPMVSTCITKGTIPIYARQLTETKKIYTLWDKNNYMLGKPGDYIGVRADDLHDIYIIREDIFYDTYEEDVKHSKEKV